MGLPLPLFVYFRSFQTQILQKNCKRLRDSNSEGKHADHHHRGPLVVILWLKKFNNILFPL